MKQLPVVCCILHAARDYSKTKKGFAFTRRGGLLKRALLMQYSTVGIMQYSIIQCRLPLFIIFY